MRMRRSPGPPRPPRALLILAALVAGALAPAGREPARAQVHPVPPAPRPLHVLLDAGRAAALVEVVAAEPDRLLVRRLAHLRGSLPARFEVKRAPSRGGELGPGDRALLAVDGERPPFVLAGGDEPVILRPGPGEDPTAWAAAVAELAAAREEPERLRDLYLGWVDGELPSLRARALEALLAGGAPAPAPAVAPLGGAQARRRAELALAADTPSDRRAEQARLAASHPEGARALLAGLAASPAAAELFPIAVGAGRVHHLRESTTAALLRGLADPRAPVRNAAVRAARLAEGGAVLTALRRVAETDPDPRIRERAARLLAAHGKAAPMPPRPSRDGSPPGAP